MCDEKCKKLDTCCKECYSKFKEWKKEEKEPIILSAESYFDEVSYLQGQNAKETDVNHFEKNTNSWYNWNRGKNEKTLQNIKL